MSSIQSGEFPVSCSDAAISAVFKEGDPACEDTYHGIAVGNVLGKVFSMVLDQRLSQWAEDNGHSAQAQGMRTTAQLFVPRHVVDKHRMQKKGGLFCCFADLKKAWDSVDWRLLLQWLASLGIWGRCQHPLLLCTWLFPCMHELMAD